MFERFTEKAIKVIMLAQEEARRLGHNFVGTEQILLGLIGEGTGIAAKVLKSMGVNLKDARVEVEKIIGRGSGFVAVEICRAAPGLVVPMPILPPLLNRLLLFNTHCVPFQ